MLQIPRQLEPEHLRVNDEHVGAAEPGRDGLVHEVVGLDCLLGDGVNCALENVAFAARGDADRRRDRAGSRPRPIPGG
jgi:hypothetical protein